MISVKTAWHKTWLMTALVAGLVGLGVSGCNLGNKGAESNRAKPTATATRTPVENKTTEAASEKKTEVAKTTATSDPAPSSEQTEKSEKSEKKTKSRETKSSSSEKGKAHYKNCEEAKEAGAAPLHEGDPGYSRRLDRDGDGIACEK